MANKVFKTTPGAEDPALKAQREAERARIRMARTGGAGIITNEDQLRQAQDLWIQSGKPTSGPLYDTLMRVSLMRNAAIKAGKPDPITGRPNQRNVFKTPATQSAQQTPAPAAGVQQLGAIRAQHLQPFAQPTSQQELIARPSQQELAARIVQPSAPQPTTFNQAAPSVGAIAAQSGVQSTQQPNGPIGSNSTAAQANYNTQIRSQRSGYSGNRRYHPFSGS